MSLKNIISIQYGINIKLMKQQKGGFLIKTPRADFLARKVSYSPAEIAFVYHLEQHLKENRFLCFEKIIPTKDGCPYLRFDKYTYVLTDYFSKNNGNIEYKSIANCIDLINSFHSSSTNLGKTIGAKYRVGYGKDRILARNILSVLKKVRENPSMIKDQTLRAAILDSIDENIEFAENAIKIFEDDRYLQHIQRSMQEKRFIHGKLGINNIIEKDKKLYLINMFDMELNIREKDIAYFIKSLLRNEEGVDIDDIIQSFYKTVDNSYKKRLILGLILMPYEYYSIIKKMLKLGDGNWSSIAYKDKLIRVCERSFFKRKIMTSLH